MINVKMHLYHSQMTAKVLGNFQDFCNRKVRENKTEFIIFAHNCFGVNMFFLLKGFRATAWNTKDIIIGETNLANATFANIVGEAKFIDTLKYYQKRFKQLAANLSVDEKLTV